MSTSKIYCPSNGGDTAQIKHLLREMLKWASSNSAIDILPAITNNFDTEFVGINLVQHKNNLDTLRASNFFSIAFISNYNNLVLALDSGIKNGYFNKWLIGDLPPFNFANDVDPWTMCQDVPYDNPNPWEAVEVHITNINNGEITWQWGNMPASADSHWKKFSYKCRVVKEGGHWKIAYLEGFDVAKGMQKAVQ